MTKHEAVAKAVDHMEQAVKILREVRHQSAAHSPSMRARRANLIDAGAPTFRVISVMDALHDARREMVEKLTEALPDKPSFLDPLRACLVRAEIVDQMEVAVDRELSSAEIQAAIAQAQTEQQVEP